MRLHRHRWGKWELAGTEDNVARQVKRCKRCGLHRFSLLKMVVK